MAFSSLRILGGFLLACALAAVLAPLAARFQWVRDLLSPLVAVVKAVPVVSFIILALIFFSSENLSLLISALVIFPAMSAMRLFKSFRAVTFCAAVLSVFCAAAGILTSILAGTPVGSTIVAVQIALFALCSLVGWIGRR